MTPPEKKTEPSDKSDFVYPSGLRLALLMTSIFISMFLVALVRTQRCDTSSENGDYFLNM